MATFVTQAELNAKPPATKEAPFLSKNVTLIVNEWEDGLKIHNHTTKTFKQAIININKLLRGKMFNYTTEFKDYKNKAFTVDEICASIANFKLAALSQDYAPQGSLKDSFRDTAFADFFYNSHARKNKSLFIQFFNNPPKSVIETGRLIADVYPHLSHKLRQLYVENVLGDPDAKLTPQSENAFRRAAMRLSSFMSEHKHRIIINEVNGNLANYLWQALEQKVISVTKITPYWFNSDKTFLEVLPAYLYDQGVLSTMNKPTFNMYDYGSKVTPAPTVEDYYD